MKYITDLQIHSKYSRAVSKEMEIPKIWEWARIKGIDIIATGDWTHPLWMREIKANLEETGSGLLKLKKESIPFSLQDKGLDPSKGPLFMLATEVSSIYSQGGKLRRIHNLIWVPKIESADKITNALLGKGANLHSDGRPIIGMTSIVVADIVFSSDPEALLIPAHAWTPWFSLYGSESGFNSIDECFGQYSKNIHAIETGLSSDPLMNWRIKELDTRNLLSFSDAHSGPKLGREATVFELSDLSFFAIREAVINKNHESGIPPAQGQRGAIMDQGNRVAYTIEFHPEEGKYHYSGHRSCGIRQNPDETARKGTICPVCGKKLTIGVMHRVEQLAGRSEADLDISVSDFKVSDKASVKIIKSGLFPERPGYVSMVPLQEILAECLGAQVTGKNVAIEYKKLTDYFGNEFNVLLSADTDEISGISGDKISEGINKVRNRDMVVEPGYDGIFGVVKIWGEEKDLSAVSENKEQLSIV